VKEDSAYLKLKQSQVFISVFFLYPSVQRILSIFFKLVLSKVVDTGGKLILLVQSRKSCGFGNFENCRK